MSGQHRATPELWAAAEKFGQNNMDMVNCILELRARIEALEADQWLRQHAKPKGAIKAPITRDRDKTGDYLIIHDAPPPATQLHSYKVGEAEPIENWGKGHTLANPEAAMDELRTASAEARPAVGGLVERVAEAMQPGTFDWSAYEDEARAAIREMAAWLRTGRLLHAAELLEQEADR